MSSIFIVLSNCISIFLLIQALKLELYLVCWHKWEVELLTILFPLLIKKYQEKFLQLGSCLFDPFNVSWVNHINQSISIRNVVLPEFSKCLLTSNIPNIQLQTFMTEIFDVEALSWCDCWYILSHVIKTSLESVLMMVVLPALSKPRTRTLI